jgi:hypothetical protein
MTENGEPVVARTVGRRGRARRRIAGSASVLAVLLGALLVLSPLSQGAAVPSSVQKIRAPYSGDPIENVYWGSQGCGYVVVTPVLPTFDLSKGTGKGWLTAADFSCGGANSSVTLLYDVGLSSGTSFSVATGVHTLSVNWSLDYLVGLGATYSPAGGSVNAGAQVSEFAFLNDLTNGTRRMIAAHYAFYNIENATDNSTTGYSYSVTLSAAMSMLATHLYAITTYVLVLTLALVGSSSERAAAAIEMSGSYKATLRSIEVR